MLKSLDPNSQTVKRQRSCSRERLGIKNGLSEQGRVTKRQKKRAIQRDPGKQERLSKGQRKRANRQRRIRAAQHESKTTLPKLGSPDLLDTLSSNLAKFNIIQTPPSHAPEVRHAGGNAYSSEYNRQYVGDFTNPSRLHLIEKPPSNFSFAASQRVVTEISDTDDEGKGDVVMGGVTPPYEKGNTGKGSNDSRLTLKRDSDSLHLDLRTANDSETDSGAAKTMLCSRDLLHRVGEGPRAHACTPRMPSSQAIAMTRLYIKTSLNPFERSQIVSLATCPTYETFFDGVLEHCGLPSLFFNYAKEMTIRYPWPMGHLLLRRGIVEDWNAFCEDLWYGWTVAQDRVDNLRSCHVRVFIRMEF
ncbi:MAG: hypothetical protein M1819_001854 [Sarea resinae]|nr:MAG: hypothetical protein M1819_001854 [Sarea resinae]